MLLRLKKLDLSERNATGMGWYCEKALHFQHFALQALKQPLSDYGVKCNLIKCLCLVFLPQAEAVCVSIWASHSGTSKILRQ